MTTENFKRVTKALVDAADGYERDVVKRLIDAWLEEDEQFKSEDVIRKMCFIEQILGID